MGQITVVTKQDKPNHYNGAGTFWQTKVCAGLARLQRINSVKVWRSGWLAMDQGIYIWLSHARETRRWKQSAVVLVVFKDHDDVS